MSDQIYLAGYYARDRLWGLKDGVLSELSEANLRSHAVHGYVAECLTHEGATMVGYFSPSALITEDSPDYSISMKIIAFDRIWDDTETPLKVKFRQGFLSRRLSLSKNGVERKLEYQWPIFRELGSRLLSDPFTFESKDFCYELFQQIKFYRPNWL